MRILRALLGLIAIGGAAGSVLLLLTDSPGVALGTLWHSGAPESLNLAQAVIVLSIITVLALVLWVLLWRRRQSN
jgi:membrane protein DedA with SNARE-associated domain